MKVKKYQQFHESAAPVSGWEQIGNSLYRKFVFESFAQAWGFITRVIEFSQEAEHHPKITIDYNEVEMWLTTHDRGKVTTKDVELAEEINKIRI